MLPLLRIKLSEFKTNLYRQAEDEIRQSESGTRVELDLIRYFIFYGMTYGAFHNQKKRQIERDELISEFRKVKELIDINPETLFEEVLTVVHNTVPVWTSLQNWLDVSVELHIDEQEKGYKLGEYEAEYLAMYGKKPSIKIEVDNKGTLSGSLGNIVLPQVNAFCTLFSQNELSELMHDFGIKWLYERALTIR